MSPTPNAEEPKTPQSPEVTVTGITNIDTARYASRGLIFGIISLVLFIVGLLIGFVTLAGILFGVLAIMSAQADSGNSSAKVLGIIGTVLNGGLLLLSIAF